MRRGRWGVLLASAAFHALLGLLFVFDLARRPVAEAPRPMSVWLEPPAPASKPAPPSSRGAGRTARAAARTEAAPAVAALPAFPASPSSSSAPAAGVAEAPAADLRGLGGLGGGCRLSTLNRLPAEARARCQERLAQAMAEGKAPRPNLDPTGRYARDARPYLTRPPKYGCKPVAAVKDEITGQTSATIGIGCAWSF